MLTLRLITLAAILGLGACSSDDSGDANLDASTDTDVDSDADTDADTDTTDDTDTFTDSNSGWYSDTCHITDCQNHNYYCGDCIDNDSDGFTDSQDNDCLGPCDHNEQGFNTDIPGSNIHPCSQECYFDQDNGAGNDDCYWDHRCDPFQPEELNPCNYTKACSNCECEAWLASQSDQCLGYCLPLVPNGCDCFGCCQLVGTGDTFVFIGTPGCTKDAVENCNQCTPVPSCENDCGPCEICIGKPELPPECDQQTCPAGIQPCDQPGDDPCPLGQYCITGCCIVTPE